MSAPDLALTMPLSGLQLIEASAGTGKTFTLAGLYLRLVVERRRAAGDILAVTFTDAATQELKSRLRARLAACAALLDAGAPLMEEAGDAVETRQAKRLIDAALAGETRDALTRRLRLAALDIDHAPISTIHGFCRRALAEFGVLAGRALQGDLVANDRDLIETAAADCWRRAATAADPADFLALQAAFKKPEAFVKTLAALVPGARRLLPAADAGDRATALLHDALARVRMRVAEAKRAAARHSHDDVIRELHDALAGGGGAALAARLHARHPVALIDEFQDTDAQQFAIFDAIYGQRGDLVLIGDPKQAIYGFRGGDVHTYLRARVRVAEVQTLARNFRSAPAYLHALNALYAGAGERAFAQPGIGYQPLLPGGKAADDDLLIDGVPATPLTFWRDEDGTLPRGSKEKATPQLAAACASAIFDLLAPERTCLREKPGASHRALMPSDIAVLVALHDEALEIQRALSARGIASASVTRRSVFASEEAIELHALIDALADFDEARLRGVLTLRLFAATAADFARYAAEPVRWSAQLDIFAEWRRVWSARGVAAMLALVFEKHAAALLRAPQGERRMTNWLQLAELAQVAAGDCVGLRGLVDWLASRIAHADHDNEDEQLRLESDAGRVKIYTFHKSKGLQFPVVFLPFAGLSRSASNHYPREYRYREDDGAAATWIAFDKAANETSEATAARAAAMREDLAERLRILYVALTRACCAAFVAADPVGSGEPSALLHLFGLDAAKAAKKTGDDGDAVSVWLAQCLSVLRAVGGGAIGVAPLPAQATTRHAAADAADRRGAARTMPHAVRDDWRIVSYSQLASGARDEVRADRDDEAAPSAAVVAAGAAPATPSSALRGARFGTAFHELIEVADFGAWRDWRGRGAPPGQDALVERIVRRHALAAEAPVANAVLADLVARTLNAPLPIDAGRGARLADLAPASYRAEMPFHFSLGQVDTARWLALLHAHGYVRERRRFDLARIEGLMTGVLDLVVLHEGRWWVIDYKTNFLGAPAPGAPDETNPYAPAALAAAVRVGEYDLQYLIYLTALHRWLKSRDPRYDYARDVGGALYLFVRGLDARGVDGVHADKPPAALIEALDAMLGPARGAAA
ncbi:MAG: UvrD-helicase domain-containing protein [Rudaea sp.]|uniref:UvrD-helicase domain-containing protein n=1 Tax=Rudaea sp. TaxID=2136325 RepID=UPI0039E5226D